MVNLIKSPPKQVSISYKAITGQLKPSIKIEIGQWWLYRDSKDWLWPEMPEDVSGLKEGLTYVTERICAVVVTDLATTSFAAEEVKVEFMVANPTWAPYEQGDTAWFVDQNFSADEDYFRPLGS